MNQTEWLTHKFVSCLAERNFCIERSDNVARIVALEQHLFVSLPSAFRSLVTQYTYLDFNVEPFWFFANTRDATDDDWSYSLFRDKPLTHTLLAHGSAQFARPDTGSSDPTCFDTRRRTARGDCPLVRIDHEDVLRRNCVGKPREIAPSFVAFIESCLAVNGNTANDRKH